jgi:hypothetical protein
MAKKQLRIAGTEKETNREVEVAAEAYVSARDARMERTEEEVATREVLISMMQKHKLDIYRDDDHEPPLVITLVPGEVGVKVTKAKEPEFEDDEPPPRKGLSAAAASAPKED